MGYNYPYFYFQRKYPNYRYNYSNYENISSNKLNSNLLPISEKSEEKKEKIDENTDINSRYNENCEEFFEIFGIKLYFDDILIICLIFFLYNEGVKDEYLFISLILLLLS